MANYNNFSGVRIFRNFTVNFRLSFQCPAERKIEKRCFLMFFIALVLAVIAFVVVNIFGWFDGDFKDSVADLFINKNNLHPTLKNGNNITQTNSTNV